MDKVLLSGKELDARIDGFMCKKKEQYSDLRLPTNKLYTRVVEEDSDFWGVLNGTSKDRRRSRGLMSRLNPRAL